LDSLHQKKFLITGGNGFIGKYLVKQLLQQRQKVIILDNLSNSNINSKQSEFYGIDTLNNTNKKILFYEADIRNKEKLDNIFKENSGIDTCIHLAAKISVFDSIKNPAETLDVNVSGTQNVLEASDKNGVKNFVFASSAAVYGNSSNLPLKETETCNPISPYGKSKLDGEEMVAKYSKSIPNTVSLRFFNIYGIGQTLEYSGVITKFAESLTKLKPIVIYGDGNQSRDFISVKDVVKAIIMASSNYDYETKSKFHRNYSNNIFNVATGKPTKIIDLAKIMINLFDEYNKKKDIPHNAEKIIYKESIEGDILQNYADIEKMEEIIGFRYEDDIINGLKRLYKL
jgi:UDP-glucose 4-epimerase